jgi:transcriptional regulator with XRE-family HTH domain
MDRAYLLEVARRASGLTQAQLAARSGTSQATLSAYERGLKSPTLKVAARILEAAGYDLNLRRLIDWVEHDAPGVGRFWVPNILWNVETPDCFTRLEFPDLINGGPIRQWDLRDREQRKAAYEQLIRTGVPEDMIRWIDGPLLVDVWDELDLPDAVRAAWKWQIVIARGARKQDAVRLYSRGYEQYTATTWIRRQEPVPQGPPRPHAPSVRFVRTRFDPHPRAAQPGGDVDPAESVAMIAERFLGEVASSRHLSTVATWNAGVAFARRWADSDDGNTAVLLSPSGDHCVVGVTAEPYGDKAEIVLLLHRLARTV